MQLTLLAKDKPHAGQVRKVHRQGGTEGRQYIAAKEVEVMPTVAC